MDKNQARKILIAEDDVSMRRFLEVLLQKDEFDVTAAHDGAEALSIALQKDFDLIITDAVMPNLSGYDLCRILRQDPHKRSIPIILLSGHEEKEDDKCIADRYLKKDGELKETLFRAINELIVNK
ncbi:MAG: response regulator [Pyrinomonadaceae bacterium]|nr:response regulator [Pyrinomonadaceae bacterium]